MPDLLWKSGMTRKNQSMLVEAVDAARGVPLPYRDQDDWLELRHTLDESFGGVQVDERLVDVLADELDLQLTPEQLARAYKLVAEILGFA